MAEDSRGGLHRELRLGRRSTGRLHVVPASCREPSGSRGALIISEILLPVNARADACLYRGTYPWRCAIKHVPILTCKQTIHIQRTSTYTAHTHFLLSAVRLKVSHRGGTTQIFHCKTPSIDGWRPGYSQMKRQPTRRRYALLFCPTWRRSHRCTSSHTHTDSF